MVPPCHPYTHFFELSLWERALCFCFELAKVFLQGANMPPLHQKNFGIVIVGKGIMLLLRISQGISSGCQHATPTQKKFRNCHCGKGALCFCFDLAKVFRVPPCHPYTIFLELSLLWEGALCFCFDLARVFLQDATMPPLHNFLVLSIGTTKSCYLNKNQLTQLDKLN